MTDSASLPRPLLSRRSEERLGARHREILDQLEALFLAEGFAGRSVRELAARVGCSRRTLYELAASKDELVLLVFDRFLHRTGRAALDAIDESATFAEQIHAYYLGGAELQRMSQQFADDLHDDPAARRIFDRHSRFVFDTTADLVARGIEAGEFRNVEPSIVAGALAGAVQYSIEPGRTAASLHGLVDSYLDLILYGIVTE